MAYRGQNSRQPYNEVPSYYVRNKLYVGSYARTDWPTRTSRRVHDGLSIDRNFGLDTTSDDVDSSPYSSPYYINGRYNSSNLVTQRGNSASTQGIVRLTSLYDREEDFADSDIQTTIQMWQGKQIRFELPYAGKIIGNTITVKNTDGCTGLLSIYLSNTEDGEPLYETTLDLCNVSLDKFEHFKLYGINTVPVTANPMGKIYVRMEIWNEISQERSANPFNTGKKIEIAATGIANHEEAVIEFGAKNLPVDEHYDYEVKPNRPCMGLIYNDYESVPAVMGSIDTIGATVTLNGYKYDVFCFKDATHAEVRIYDRAMNKFLDNVLPADSRVKCLNIVQAKDWVYYVDGYSALRKFKIGEWAAQELPLSTSDEDANPVIAASIIYFHNNRIYLSGFRFDPNLVQFTEITGSGPDFDSYPYRFYSPDKSPLATSANPIVELVELDNSTLIIVKKESMDQFVTNGKSTTPEDSYPRQVPMYSDGGGVQDRGDICNYRGRLYSFDQDEGIRRFTGSTWNRIPQSLDSHIERVDMSKPRKMWGYANKLYFNYTDRIDHKYKCIIWDMAMNYQQYPWFQDVDWPFCDIRCDDNFELIGSHPEYPCVMSVLAQDVWRRFDTPITFERWTKYLSLPGNASDAILKNVHVKVIANANRWWMLGVSVDKHMLEQHRNKTVSYRFPCWDTLDTPTEPEDLFTERDIFSEKAISLLTIGHIKIKNISAQVKIKCKTFRKQANLVSVVLEEQPEQYL